MKLNFLKSIIKPKQPYAWILVILLALVCFLFPETALAGLSVLEGFVATVFGWIVYGLVWVIGQLLVVVIWVLVEIAQYNNFINNDTVTMGWGIVRDLCNMFFILIMLIVAFCTVLRIQGFEIKALLKSIIIMAILINFSKLICGVIIDFSQVIMLTFVNAFRDIGGGNFTHMLGIDSLLDMDPEKMKSDTDITVWSLLGAFLLALIYAVVALVVMVAITATLAMRMVMLWIYVILSPFAYLLAIIPATKSYSSLWWKQFTQNVVVGPVLAFFIWLSLATLGAGDGSVYEKVYKDDAKNLRQSEALTEASRTGNAPGIGQTKIGTTDHMISFIISIGLLIGGLMVAQQIGGAAGSMAGKVSHKAMAGAGWMRRRTGAGVRKVAGGAGRRVAKRAGEISGVAGFRKYRADARAGKEATRADRVESQARTWDKNVGKIKGKTIGAASKWVSSKWNNFGGNQAEVLRKKANEDRLKKQDLQQGIGEEFRIKKEKYDDMSQKKIDDIKIKNISAGEVKLLGANYEFDSKKNEWKDSLGGTVSEKDMSKLIKKDSLENDIKTTEAGYDKSIKQNEQEAKNFEKKQNVANKVGKYGLIGGGALTGVATFGAGFWGALAAAAGASAGNSLGQVKELKKSGEMEKNRVQDYLQSKIDNERSKIKDSDDIEVLNGMDDKTKTPVEQMAYVEEAMFRNKLDSEQEGKYREKFKKEFGGSVKGKEDEKGLWNFNKLGSKFEKLTTDGASRQYDRAYSKKSDPEVAERERNNIQREYQTGERKMKDVDLNGLKLSIEELARGLKPGKFIKEFKELDKSRQDAIIRALKGSDSFDARSKLAGVTDIKTAFAGMKDVNKAKEYREDYVKKLKPEDINDAVTKGTEESIDALKDYINGDNMKVSESVRTLDSPTARSARKRLGIK
ncbi:MAG: hypothetical protein ABIG10_03870 [bacterium]